MATENARKIIVLLLILAIIFSTISIIIGITALKEAPAKYDLGRGPQGNSAGTVGLFVETSPEASGG